MNTLQLQKFSTFLCKNNYKVHTIELYSKSLIEFKPTPQDSISQLYKEILEFEKRNKANLSKALFNNLRAALRLYFLMETGITFKTYKSSLVLPNDNFQNNLLKRFYQYSIEFKKISKNTVISECHHIREFLDIYPVNSNDDLSSISVYDIRNYVSNHMRTLKPSTKGRYITSIRNFFRYLEYENITIDKAIIGLPLTIANWNNKIPTVLSEGEESRLRNFYKSNDTHDVRNKLIILLQLDLGLRSSEIPKLQLNNIHWSTGSILVSDTKTNHNREIPMTTEIGSLLENYVMYFRGKTSNCSLFLSLNPRKKNQSIDTEDVRRVVRHAMKKEKIVGYWKGTHVLRRTAASKLYNSKVGLKVTADILGHESLDSTVHYVKVDFETMKSITTPWPGGDLNA